LKSKLRSLYLLELLDTQLDSLREDRGDLPEKVHELEANVLALKEKIDECDTILEVGAAERTRKEKDTLEYQEKIKKYQSQQLQVRSNKEYDALSNEIDMATQLISAYEADVERFIEEAELIRERKLQHQAEYEVLDGELQEKKKDLDEILQLNAEEEAALMKRRVVAVRDVPESDLVAYTRIRRAKGRAVVPVKRSSCSGCFNVVPPQKILELKKFAKVYTCEHCGRILVPEEFSQEVTL
jgi:predicted  nucleic acid-binding Zn-ribbon protein